ncbi:hypothetical protein [Dactylosporangium sp. CA-139066]|uniref:hypothetical protein n=1 Tax=Dactylosporangium sp. CA-139066 TaxID=3239930 RepID=UPI003D942BDA
MPKTLLRLGLAAAASIIAAALGQPAQAAPVTPASDTAAPAAPVLNDLNTPVSDHQTSGRALRLSATQYAADRQAAGSPLSAAEQARLAASQCWTWTRSQWKDNIYGGTLFRINGTINWCQDGSSVWGGSYSWSTYTNFGWYFDSWSNSPTGYYNPAHTRYDTVAQAKFCITWCAGSSYLGQDMWGNANATYGSSNL